MTERKNMITTKTKKLTGQRELESFFKELFQEAGKDISFQCLNSPKRWVVKVDGKVLSDIFPDEWKAIQVALDKSGIGGKLSRKGYDKNNDVVFQYARRP